MTREEELDWLYRLRSEMCVYIPKGWVIPTIAALNAAMKSLEQEPKTGHWIFDEVLDRHYYCSECKSMGVNYWDYCPNCGAKMVEPPERI